MCITCAVASSTLDTALETIANTDLLPPPIHLENRFEVLMNEESFNEIEHRLNQPVASNANSRSSKQQHSAKRMLTQGRANSSTQLRAQPSTGL